MKKILMVAVEAKPYATAGGTSDVVGALSRELRQNGYDVRLVLPYYAALIRAPRYRIRQWADLDVVVGGPADAGAGAILEQEGVPHARADPYHQHRLVAEHHGAAGRLLAGRKSAVTPDVAMPGTSSPPASSSELQIQFPTAQTTGSAAKGPDQAQRHCPAGGSHPNRCGSDRVQDQRVCALRPCRGAKFAGAENHTPVADSDVLGAKERDC